MQKTEFINLGTKFKDFIIIEAENRFKDVEFLDTWEFVHEHLASASLATLMKFGYYIYCESTVVVEGFDRHENKRTRRSKRGIRDIIAVTGPRNAIIVEVESWKEKEKRDLDSLLSGIIETREVPELKLDLSLILIYVWRSESESRRIQRYTDQKLLQLSKATYQSGYLQIQMQAIPSHFYSFILDKFKRLTLIRHVAFWEGTSLQL